VTIATTIYANKYNYITSPPNVAVIVSISERKGRGRDKKEKVLPWQSITGQRERGDDDYNFLFQPRDDFGT
jgi:hypothetical protein